jgi:hypothetical protein
MAAARAEQAAYSWSSLRAKTTMRVKIPEQHQVRTALASLRMLTQTKPSHLVHPMSASSFAARQQVPSQA